MATMLSRIKKAVKEAGRIVTIRIGREKRQITDTELAEAIENAATLYYDIKAIEPALKEYKTKIAQKARLYLDDKGTITFIIDELTECKVTFQYEAVIPEERIGEVKKLLGKRFNDLVKIKTTYIATQKLIELATDADQGKELAELITVKEKAAQFVFKK